MPTPAPVFTPFLKSISWTDSTTDSSGNPLPAGETLADTVIGVRADSFGGIGNYQYTAIIAAPASSVTPAALNAAIGVATGKSNFVLPPGNYWLNGQQTNTLDGTSATSSWGATETPFSVPVPIVQPSNPTGFTVA